MFLRELESSNRSPADRSSSWTYRHQIEIHLACMHRVAVAVVVDPEPWVIHGPVREGLERRKVRIAVDLHAVDEPLERSPGGLPDVVIEQLVPVDYPGFGVY